MNSVSISLKETKYSYDAAGLVQLACTFQSRLTIRNNQGEYNVKSIMGMLSLNPRDGLLTVTADGPDEEAALSAVVEFMKSEKNS